MVLQSFGQVSEATERSTILVYGRNGGKKDGASAFPWRQRGVVTVTDLTHE